MYAELRQFVFVVRDSLRSECRFVRIAASNATSAREQVQDDNEGSLVEAA